MRQLCEQLNTFCCSSYDIFCLLFIHLLFIWRFLPAPRPWVRILKQQRWIGRLRDSQIESVFSNRNWTAELDVCTNPSQNLYFKQEVSFFFWKIPYNFATITDSVCDYCFVVNYCPKYFLHYFKVFFYTYYHLLYIPIICTLLGMHGK
jgi:hypothetical protein